MAWSALVNKYSALVYTAADTRLKKHGFTLPKEDIEDICQDIFASIWRENKLNSVANTNNISYWIAMVSGNMAIDHVRNSKTRERLRSWSIHEKFDEKEFSDIIPSKIIRPDNDTKEVETAKKIDKAIRNLPPREKLIIKLHLIHGKKYDQIADMLNLPRGTVSSYIKRAKQRLKAALKNFLIIFAIILALSTSYI